MIAYSLGRVSSSIIGVALGKKTEQPLADAARYRGVHQIILGPDLSDHAYRVLLRKRALAHGDAELFGHRPRYLEVARRLAALLLSTELLP